MYVCICNNVNDRAIRRAVAGGASTLEDLSAELGVATQCGQCACMAQDLLDEELSRRTFSAPAFFYAAS
ncbi:MAG: bacterioferritin-associated ferredoxin [Pseudomonadales bacterium]|nr:bacterioferritin-associated ferredoxin [Pseudomonadales bacterium]